MKFNRKCVKSMYSLICAFFLFLTVMSCQKESAYSELLTQKYPELYTHVFERNADSLLTFIDHPDSFVRDQAWRALISTPIEDMDDFITKVQYADNEQGWTALSAQELNDEHLSRLHGLWERRNTMRKGISRVLGLRGNQESLDLLVRNFDEIIGEDSEYEYDAALAMGRLMASYEVSSSAGKRSILRYAAVLDDEDLFRAYFYGLYRSNKAVEDEGLQTNIWEAYEWVESPKIKQYVLRISFNSNAEKTFERLPIEDISTMNVQLAVELAQQTAKVGWSEKLELVYTRLLTHSNPVVNEVALAQIEKHPEKNTAFDEVIIQEIIQNEEKEASVRLSGIEVLSDAADFVKLAETLAEDDVYLLNKKLSIAQKVKSADEYLELIREHAQSENRMEALFASQALSGWWAELTEMQKTSSRKATVRDLIFELMNRGDRSITYVTVPFMESSGVIENNDFERIEGYLSQYRLPEDIEVYQVFGGFLFEQFQKQAKPLIDSLAQKGNFALNGTLRQQGWDIPEQENVTNITFRQPNWERLGQLGYEPTWVLETEKGIIKIAMDVLSAPATISGIDSLTRAGAYNEVAFHRVVPNFVIQGGDIETGDGFGGPDYVVPTEASEKEYRRGMVGIASAGTDTEGSQYFVMHDWAPHLNGRYTIIGEVTEGMSVVDRILVGDKVTKAYWQIEE